MLVPFYIAPPSASAPVLTLTPDDIAAVAAAVLRVPAGETVSSADMTLRATIGAAFSAGPVLTMALSQINVLDVTGDEASWL